MQPRNVFKPLKIRKFQSSEILHARQCTHMLLNKAKVLILADGFGGQLFSKWIYRFKVPSKLKAKCTLPFYSDIQ